MTTKKKPVGKTSAKKAVKKSTKKSFKSRVTAQALMKAELLDQILLKLAPEPYTKLIQSLAEGKKKISEERQIALDIGTRILSKAKDVRDNIMSRAGLK